MASEHGCGKLDNVAELLCPEVFGVTEVVVPEEVFDVVGVGVLVEDFALCELLTVVVVCLPAVLVDPQAASTSPIVNKAAILRMTLLCLYSIKKALFVSIYCRFDKHNVSFITN